VLGWAQSSVSMLGVNPWPHPHESHGFLPNSQKPSSLSSSKIKKEILGHGKKPFWELVLGVEVMLVSKFHSIWSIIAQ
jgi:hypothetical protein